MNDFLITTMMFYPWAAWLLAVLAAIGIGYGSLWVAGGIMLVSDWAGYRRLVWRSKSVVRKAILDADCAVCKVFEDDPPDYQHPDGDDDDWADGDEPLPGEIAGLATVLARAREAGLLDDEPLPDDELPRCNDRDCDMHGFIHPPPCRLMPTMPAACYAEGPAMPPQPWSGLDASLETLARGDNDLPVHPAVARELGHDTTEAAVDSMFTRAQAAEVVKQLIAPLTEKDEPFDIDGDHYESDRWTPGLESRWSGYPERTERQGK